jgi:hypothetical protein
MDTFEREELRKKENFRIARHSTTSEARIPAFRYLAGNDEAYDIFIDGLNHVHVGIVETAIFGLAAFDDSRWEILLDLLEDEDFGYSQEILSNIIHFEKDLSNHIDRLRKIIVPRKDVYDLLVLFEKSMVEDSVDYSVLCDALARDCGKYHDAWTYGNHRFIKYLDTKHPLSLNLVKRMLFNENLIERFQGIIALAKVEFMDSREEKVLWNFNEKLFSFFSTLISLSNKYQEHDEAFDLKSRILYFNHEPYYETVSEFSKAFESYLQGKIKTRNQNYQWSNEGTPMDREYFVHPTEYATDN